MKTHTCPNCGHVSQVEPQQARAGKALWAHMTPDIVEAARKIEIWAKMHGYDAQELLELCSRDHARKLEELKRGMVQSAEAMRQATKAVVNTTIREWERRAQSLAESIEEESESMGIMADNEDIEHSRGCRDGILGCITDLQKISVILERPIEEGGK